MSNSVSDFTVTLLGFYFADHVAVGGGSEGRLATFLKWEQLAAYARAHGGERGFRGTERVVRRLAEGDRIRIGADQRAQILSSQKTYGLWGLYVVPSKASGLLEGDPTRLTADAFRVVEDALVPRLASGGAKIVRDIVDRLKADEHTLDLREGSKDDQLLRSIGALLKDLRSPERRLYRERLVNGGPGDLDPQRGTGGKQQLFAQLLVDTIDESDWSLNPESMATLSARARRVAKGGSELASRLDRIRAAESLLAPAASFFEYAMGCDGQKPKEIAESVGQHWGDGLRSTLDLESIEALEPELRSSGEPTAGRRWVRIAEALHHGRYEDALTLTLDQNALVMQARSAAAPWASIRDGRLQVRFRDQQPEQLPDANELPGYWRHAYFIESLRDVAGALRGAS